LIAVLASFFAFEDKTCRRPVPGSRARQCDLGFRITNPQSLRLISGMTEKRQSRRNGGIVYLLDSEVPGEAKSILW
jgi:hypothetical protein